MSLFCRSRATSFFAGLAAVTVVPMARCLAAETGAPTPTLLPRPLRIAFGYDNSSTNGSREGGLALFGGTPTTTNQDGALRISLSYDVWQDRSRAWTGQIYSDDEIVIFDPYFYYSLGFAVRRPIGSPGGIRPYYGAGIGFYDVWLPDTTTIGLKLFAGLQDQGSAFIEAGVTVIATGGYTPGLAVVIGLRL